MKIIHAVIRKLRPRARHPDGVREKKELTLRCVLVPLADSYSPSTLKKLDGRPSKSAWAERDIDLTDRDAVFFNSDKSRSSSSSKEAMPFKMASISRSTQADPASCCFAMIATMRAMTISKARICPLALCIFIILQVLFAKKASSKSQRRDRAATTVGAA